MRLLVNSVGVDFVDLFKMLVPQVKIGRLSPSNLYCILAYLHT